MQQFGVAATHKSIQVRTKTNPQQQEEARRPRPKQHTKTKHCQAQKKNSGKMMNLLPAVLLDMFTC